MDVGAVRRRAVVAAPVVDDVLRVRVGRRGAVGKVDPVEGRHRRRFRDAGLRQPTPKSQMRSFRRRFGGGGRTIW